LRCAWFSERHLRRKKLARARRQQFGRFSCSEQWRAHGQFPPQPVFIVVARRQVQRAAQELQHLHIASRYKIALSQRHTGLSFVVITALLTKVFERRVKLGARHLLLTLSDQDTSQGERRCSMTQYVTQGVAHID